MEEFRILNQYNLILIRYGEVWLKSQKVKIRMLKVLINNIIEMLDRNQVSFSKYQLSKDSSRILFFFKNEDILKALKILRNTFGIHSISPALRTSDALKNICERSIEIGKEILEKNDTFAIRVKRSGKHEYSSMDVAKKVGEVIINEFIGLNLKVNLTNPKKKIFIEVRQEFTYIFTDIIGSKWGGLPIETQKKIIIMDVGKLNDLISGFLLMRRGSEIFPLLFSLSDKEENNYLWYSNWKEVYRYVPFKNFKVRKVRIVEILKEVYNKIEDKQYICAICRLIRFDIISKLIEESKPYDFRKIRAISDGMGLINNSLCPDEVDLNTIIFNYLFSKLPIFTPIIGLSLKKVEKYAQRISANLKTFDYCQFKPKDQDFDKERVKSLYKSLNLNNLIENALKNAEIIKIE